MPVKKYHHGNLKSALIKAAIEILANEGVNGLSLRKTAYRAGVSHTAPYAHFADKQELIAAVSTEGFRIISKNLERVIKKYENKPICQLVEACWAYVQFALKEPAHFKITLSGVLQREKEYPAFVEMTHRSFSQMVQIVENCQAAGLLREGPSDIEAINIWSMIHGFVSLLLERQLFHTILERYTIRDLMISAIGHLTIIDLTPDGYKLLISPAKSSH